jgi:hypothetical protein
MTARGWRRRPSTLSCSAAKSPRQPTAVGRLTTPLQTVRFPKHAIRMRNQVHAFEFSDTAFVVGSDPVVCVVPLSMLQGYMTLAELDDAFSGHASYRQAPWMKRYVGVWGRKNCQRLRRFLRERGADVVIHRERPLRLGLASYKTRATRKKVRLLAAPNER